MRVESIGGLLQEPREGEINHHLWVASFDVWRCQTHTQAQEDKDGARKGDLCFETHLLIDVSLSLPSLTT